MSDKVMLPCEHGEFKLHYWCTGGRVVEIDYEAAREATVEDGNLEAAARELRKLQHPVPFMHQGDYLCETCDADIVGVIEAWLGGER